MQNPLSRFRVRRTPARRSVLRIGQLEDRTVPALNVVSASPAPEWASVPVTHVDLTFDNPVNPASVQAGDLLLLRNNSSFGSVSSAQVVPGTNSQTVRFTISGYNTPGNLQTIMRPGSVLAANGDPNEAYSATYTLTSLGFSPVRPLGSLIYSGTSSGTNHTFALDAGQTVTVDVSGPSAVGAALTVTLRGPAGATGAGPVLGTASAPHAGASALLQSIVVPDTGLYTATISGASPAGGPTIRVYLNAVKEVEGTRTGASNNTPATAESLTDAFKALTPAADSPTRAGVAGTFTGSPDHYSFGVQAGQTVSVGFTQENTNDRLFAPAAYVNQSPTVGTTPTDVAVGDLNGDGLPDLVHTLANLGGTSIPPGEVVVKYSLGTNGTYLQSPTTSTGGLNPRAIRLADLNGDGKLDAVVANQLDDSVGVLFGTGSNPFEGETPGPAFSDPVVYAAGMRPGDLAVGDLDLDGDPDIVVGNGQGNMLTVLTNAGNGSFGLVASYGTGGFNMHGVAIGDVTGDGNPDIVATTVDNAGLTVLPGIGSGGFGFPIWQAAASSPQDVVLGDFNRDGRLDAAVLSRTGAGATVSMFPNQNNPFGPFSAGAAQFSISGSSSNTPYRLAAADFDMDGWTDLVASTGLPGQLPVLLGGELGLFETRFNFSMVPPGLPTTTADGVTTADVNLDGTPDVVTANPASSANNLSVVPNGLSRLRADLVDASGNVLAAGAPTANLTSSIAEYTAPAAGTYYLRVTGTGRTDYAAVVTRGGAAFDAEPNSTPAAAQPLGTTGALGHIGAPSRMFDVIVGGSGQIREINPATGAVIRSFSAPGGVVTATADNIGLAFDGNSLFYLLYRGSPVTLYELDPDTGAVRDSDVLTAYPSNGIDGLAALNGKVYLADSAGQRIVGFDPVTDRITQVVGGWAGYAVRGGLAGATNPDRILATVSVSGGSTQVAEIDPATGRMTAIFATGGSGTTPIPSFSARGLAFIDGEVHITRIDGGSRTDVYSRDGQYLRTVTPSPLVAVLTLGGDDLGQSTVDWYSVPVAFGDELRLTTGTPADGSGGFGNALDPRIELFDLNGVRVATGTPGPDGRNETLAFAPAASGTFRVRVTSQNNTAGEYILSADTVPVDNGPPVAGDDTPTTDEDTAVNVAVLANDSDPDNDPLTIASVTQPANGSATINADGTIRYTPAANYHGADTFTYTISDGNGGSDTASVYVSIAAVNDAPFAGDNAYTVAEDELLTVNAPGVRDNDGDVDGGTPQLVLLTTPSRAPSRSTRTGRSPTGARRTSTGRPRSPTSSKTGSGGFRGRPP